MKTLKIISAIILIIAISSCKKENIVSSTDCDCNYADSSSSHPKNATFRAVIDKYVQMGLPGISVLVEDSNGVWVGAGGYADIENNIKFTPCHISKAASITKFLVATLFFKLQEEGKINIDDPVSNYIDASILKKIKNADGITIRQLMNHTTGIFDVITSSDFYLAVLNNPNKDWTQEELLKYVYGVNPYELNNPYPAHYSSTNTLLLSMCIENATGEKHDKLLREKVLEPLGMTSTYYQGREEIPSTAAQGYFDLHNNGKINNVSNLITGSGNGYGGIFSNVFDLHKFIKAVLIDKTILSQASLDQMLNFTQEDTDFYTGYGIIKKFTLKQNYGIGHTGRDLGYNADLFYFPERNITMVFFVNYGTNGESALKQVFFDFESELVDKILE
ncbi:MAG TPA: serine hydrolase [Bacteroidales bacterium]|nr:serine hydrolase [Bacteroidales bacterium]HPS17607.1 serine hydrolase [Bacteroidales bacterium]